MPASSFAATTLLLLDAAAAFAPSARGISALPLPTTPACCRTASPILQEGGGSPLAGIFSAGKEAFGKAGALLEKKEAPPPPMEGEGAEGGDAAIEPEDDGKMTIEKVASFGIAGILSIAVAETVFWVLSFPTSELLYFASTGEWIDLLTQEGQLKFLAFTAGWGAIGGVIAQYRTVLTAAAMTPWMDRCVCRLDLPPPHTARPRVG